MAGWRSRRGTFTSNGTGMVGEEGIEGLVLIGDHRERVVNALGEDDGEGGVWVDCVRG
jgi:hypothetical protein